MSVLPCTHFPIKALTGLERETWEATKAGNDVAVLGDFNLESPQRSELAETVAESALGAVENPLQGLAQSAAALKMSDSVLGMTRKGTENKRPAS